MEQKKYEEAVGFFKAALRLRRDASDTHYALAFTYRQLGEKDGYKEELKAALIFDPSMPEANYDMGNVLLSEGDVAGAAEHFRRAADAAPNVAKPRIALSKLGSAREHLAKAKALEATDAKSALAEARIASALNPRSVEAALLVAKLYEKAGKRQDATDAYQKVIEIDPGNEDATKGLKRTNSGS
jgi:tetratricopeptide (TPR) repeat protein